MQESHANQYTIAVCIFFFTESHAIFHSTFSCLFPEKLQSKKHIVEYCNGQSNQHSENNPAILVSYLVGYVKWKKQKRERENDNNVLSH